jgi:hypothetical protein
MFSKSPELVSLKPSAIASQTDPFGRPVLSRSVRRPNDPCEFNKGRILLQCVACDYRVERTVFAVVIELSAVNVENHAVSDSGPIGVVGQKGEFGICVDESPDQPRTGNSVDLRLLSRHPSHEACPIRSMIQLL